MGDAAGDGVQQEAAGAPHLVLSDMEFMQLWMLGLTQEKSIGKPREWKGNDEQFEEFQYKFTNYMSGLPGDGRLGVKELLKAAQAAPDHVGLAGMTPRQRIIAGGIDRMLKALCGGRALNILKGSSGDNNGFEAWRLLFAEYRPTKGGRNISLLEAVMDSKPEAGESFGAWYARCLEIVRQTDSARTRPVDDDLKCAVVRRSSPKELSDIAEDFS